MIKRASSVAQSHGHGWRVDRILGPKSIQLGNRRVKRRRGVWATMVSCLSAAGAEADTVPRTSNGRAGAAVQGQPSQTAGSGPRRSSWLPLWARVAEPTAALGIPADLVRRQPPTRSPVTMRTFVSLCACPSVGKTAPHGAFWGRPRLE